jgi:mannan endo-1,4-beta-mannosidase
MLLGEGMTAQSCYPQLLSQEFRSQGHTNFQFVGTNQISQSCKSAPAVPTEAHPSCRVTNLETNNPSTSGQGSLSQLQGWVAQAPDIVLMDLGSADTHDGSSTVSILSALLFVVNQFRSQNPDVIFFVSKVTPVSASRYADWASSVVDLNSQIADAWAASNSTAAAPIFIIDQWTGFDATADTSDGVIPDMSGSQKMADNAYAAVSAHNYF